MMKMTRFFIFWAKIFLLIVLMVFIFNGFFLKPLLSSSLGLFWNADVSMNRAQIDWSLPGIVLDQVKIGNPYGFPREEMIQIERVSMRFDKNQPFLAEGSLKPALLEVQINKIALMRRVSGHLNLHLLVQPEALNKKKKGLGLSPKQTRFVIGEVSETDATSPLLKKQNYDFKNKEFLIGEKSSFGVIAQIFAKDLFQRIGLSEEGNAPISPAPEYHGIAASVEQEIREHADEEAKREAAEAQFEALSAGDASVSVSSPN